MPAVVHVLAFLFYLIVVNEGDAGNPFAEFNEYNVVVLLHIS